MTALPAGFGVTLDPSTRVAQRGRLLWGGTPTRVLRLTAAGAAELARLRAAPPLSPAGRRLGRRLIDAGLAHPAPPRPSSGDAVTVVVPVRDRPEALDRCLSALGDVRTVVVDDGSVDGDAILRVCRIHGVRLRRRAANAGPAAARNTGLAEVDTPLVAFVDSDCIASPGWIGALTGHFDDPLVAAVAPRVRGVPRSPDCSTPARYLACRSPLHMGTRPAAVCPSGAVPYVPTAALLVRRAALDGGFDDRLRYGEDVDLVWRLHDQGWRIRYDPTVVVEHEEPATWRQLTRRRFHYGTSAGALSQRHPGRLAPLLLQPWPGAALLALVLQRPRTAAAITAAGGGVLTRRLRATGIPLGRRWGLVAKAGLRTYRDVVTTAVTLLPPVVAGLTRRRHRGWWAAVLVAPYLLEWLEERPPLDPMRWTVARIVDDAAYGMGVWWGAVRARTVAPLRPATRTARDPRDGPRDVVSRSSRHDLTPPSTGAERDGRLRRARDAP